MSSPPQPASPSNQPELDGLFRRREEPTSGQAFPGLAEPCVATSSRLVTRSIGCSPAGILVSDFAQPAKRPGYRTLVMLSLGR